MKNLIFFTTLLISLYTYSQNFNQENSLDLSERISTIDFVEIIDANIEEALYYYQNNWKVLRQGALVKDYILSYQLLKTPLTDDNKFELLLIT
ncbi:MAG: hypothetical protein HKN90_08700, partial [Flavobacteriaceae bacterium]|nr:hypothetical protein [Flavobacteriaceae bacterium]